MQGLRRDRAQKFFFTLSILFFIFPTQQTQYLSKFPHPQIKSIKIYSYLLGTIFGSIDPFAKTAKCRFDAKQALTNFSFKNCIKIIRRFRVGVGVDDGVDVGADGIRQRLYVCVFCGEEEKERAKRTASLSNQRVNIVG